MLPVPHVTALFRDSQDNCRDTHQEYTRAVVFPGEKQWVMQVDKESDNYTSVLASKLLYFLCTVLLLSWPYRVLVSALVASQKIQFVKAVVKRGSHLAPAPARVVSPPI